MRALRGVPVHMLSEASEDLNLSFVVDEQHADALVADLHAELLESPAAGAAGDSAQFGPTWAEMTAAAGARAAADVVAAAAARAV
jgi:diaminopimelate decarboxylase/aspartate kinase